MTRIVYILLLLALIMIASGIHYKEHFYAASDPLPSAVTKIENDAIAVEDANDIAKKSDALALELNTKRRELETVEKQVKLKNDELEKLKTSISNLGVEKKDADKVNSAQANSGKAEAANECDSKVAKERENTERANNQVIDEQKNCANTKLEVGELRDKVSKLQQELTTITEKYNELKENYICTKRTILLG